MSDDRPHPDAGGRDPGPENTPAAEPPPARPVRPRWLWTRRLAIGSVTVLVLLGGLYVCWSTAAERAYDAAVAEIRARGEPLLAEDFVTPPIPDEENALVPLLAALDRLAVAPEGGLSLDEVRNLTHLDADQRPAARVTLAANAEALRLIDEALERPRMHWKLDVSKGLIDAALPSAFALHQLARLVYLRAIYRTDGAARLQRAEQLLRMSDLLNQLSNMGVVVHFLALKLSDMAADTAVAGVVEPLDTRSPPQDAGESTRRLISAFLRDDHLQDGWRTSLIAERAVMYEWAADLTSASRHFPGRFVRPMFLIDMAMLLRFATAQVDTGLKEDAKSLRDAARLVPDLPEPEGVAALTRLITLYVALDLGSSSVRRLEQLAWRRVAAGRLALELYKWDCGDYPDSLDRLVPRYLPAVPVDPLFGDGRAIRYVPHGDKAGVYAGPAAAQQASAGTGRSRRDNEVIGYALQADAVSSTQPGETVNGEDDIRDGR